jgi:hypothetical protein
MMRRRCLSSPTPFGENLQRSENCKKIWLLSWPFPSILRVVRAEYLFLFRLENVIKELKTTPTDINPATNFWTVYKKVADEHDGDMIDKYSGDLDTSLLFVSTFISIVHLVSTQLSMLGGSVLRYLHGFHCSNHSIASAKPFRPHQCPTASAIATQRFVRRIRPAGTRDECFPHCSQSSVNPLCKLVCHFVRGLHRGVGQAMDPVL